MKFRKITALLLVLCMLLSLSISAFAAEADEHTIYDSAPDEETAVSTEAATSGTIQNSGIRWSLDEKGWLTISGSGEAPVFTSADDQPWAAVRNQITEVWFEDVDTLTIPDLAYWFEGCVNLTTALPPLRAPYRRFADSKKVASYDNQRLSYDATENCLYLLRAVCIIIKNVRSVYYGIK